ncbi:MAG: hypothetical protein AAF799_00570 [Myxococcota bacterium]
MNIRKLHLASTITALTLGLGALACDPEGSPDDSDARDGLLFGLHDSDVVALHDRYLPDEDLGLTFDRLTAPFDCSLYGDLCAQVGEDQAIEITEELVELGLDGASPEQIDAFLDQRTDEAMDLRAESEELSDDFTFRSSTGWFSRTVGNVRMLTRNGITTPVIGSRQAWTEAKTQRRNGLGTWFNRKATEICVNAGTNTQVQTVCGGGIPCADTTLESFNPSNTCVANKVSHKSTTFHARNNGAEPGGGFSLTYKLTARGCSDAEINGVNLSLACAPAHLRFY